MRAMSRKLDIAGYVLKRDIGPGNFAGNTGDDRNRVRANGRNSGIRSGTYDHGAHGNGKWLQKAFLHDANLPKN